MDHDGNWMRTGPRRHAQLAELKFATTVCDSRARRRIQDASEHVGHTLLSPGNIIESSVSRRDVTLSQRTWVSVIGRFAKPGPPADIPSFLLLGRVVASDNSTVTSTDSCACLGAAF
jgi:hypothetical protein